MRVWPDRLHEALDAPDRNSHVMAQGWQYCQPYFK